MVYTIMGAMFVANVVMAIIMFGSMKRLAKLVQIPRPYLLPLILCFAVIGSYALSNRVFDIYVMLGFGLLGFCLESFRIPLAPFVIGFVLGPIAEKNLSLGLQASNGSYAPILTQPISLVFVIISILMLAVPAVRSIRRNARERRQAS